MLSKFKTIQENDQSSKAWKSGQPDNFGNEDCVVMLKDIPKINDVKCDRKEFSICELKRLNSGTTTMDY